MPRVIFEFKTQHEQDRWLAQWHDGNGEQEMMESFEMAEDIDYPEIKITEEE